jgi:hypothetical protein
MLRNFFKLDEPSKEYNDLTLVEHFQHATEIDSVYYKSQVWPSDLPKLDGITFRNVNLSRTLFSHVTFKKCAFEDCLFIGTAFVEVEFHRCTFKNCNFWKCSFDGCYLDPTSIYLDSNYRKTAQNVGLSLYHALYENASKTKQADHEMKADIEFRRWKRWQLDFDRRDGKINRFDYFARRFASLLYEYVAGFGYKPWRFVAATIVVFTTIALINRCVLVGALAKNGNVITTMTMGDSVYYTYSMLTALGFSTIAPVTDYAKIASVLEALCGIGWLGIFTSLLVKRFIK